MSKVLARRLGLQSAVLFSELLSKEEYFTEREMLNEEGFFYCTIQNIEDDTTLKERVQSKCIKLLKDEGLIDYEVKGMPATRYFRCCSEDFLYDYLRNVGATQFRQNEETSFTSSEDDGQFRQNDETSFVKRVKPVSSKPRLNKNKENKNKDNKKERKDLAEGHDVQKTLFNLPKKEVVQSKKKLTVAEQSIERISSAKETGDWSAVTDTNFTHYFLQQHNERYAEISFDRYSSVGIIRDSFIKRHDIPKEKVCDYIDFILDAYKTHPKKSDSLTFYMIDKFTSLMKDLIRTAQVHLNPVEETIQYNKFSKKQDTLKNDSETFHSNEYF